jgi:hypothetical protein
MTQFECFHCCEIVLADYYIRIYYDKFHKNIFCCKLCWDKYSKIRLQNPPLIGGYKADFRKRKCVVCKGPTAEVLVQLWHAQNAEDFGICKKCFTKQTGISFELDKFLAL